MYALHFIIIITAKNVSYIRSYLYLAQLKKTINEDFSDFNK
jgi:hypothetical protein